MSVEGEIERGCLVKTQSTIPAESTGQGSSFSVVAVRINEPSVYGGRVEVCVCVCVWTWWE